MLSFIERRAVVKIILEQNVILANNPSFTERRKAVKLKLDALAKLGKLQAKQPSSTDTTDTNALAENSIIPEGKDSKIKTAKGNVVDTKFTVIDADQLIISHDADGNLNPEYPKEFQPRDRGRETSQAWVKSTAKDLDPDLLGKSRNASFGAPIIGNDKVVESGNGRAAAILLAYKTGKAEEYRDWLIENADDFKISESKIKSMKRPVLVRVRLSNVDRVQFAMEANQSDMLAMTATEKARADANRLDDTLISSLSSEGDLTAAVNRDFILAFLRSLGTAEAAQHSTTDGMPTKQLYDRVQAALFAKSYNDDRLLQMMADSEKPEIANTIKALNQAAPYFVRARSISEKVTDEVTSKVGDAVELSLDQKAINALVEATKILKMSKDSGMQLEEFLKQGMVFDRDEIDPVVAQMALFIKENNRSPARMGAAFQTMAEFVANELERRQNNLLFPDDPEIDLVDVIKAANMRLKQLYGDDVKAIGIDDTEQNDNNSQSTDLPTDELEKIKVSSSASYNFDPNRKKSERSKDNKAAIALLSQIDAGLIDSNTLTDEQKAILAKYSGTGGALEGADGKKGSAYEYYTPKPIAESMWGLLSELGFKGGKVLDPSSGVGIFGGTAPNNAAVDAVELNQTSGRINGLVNSGAGNHVTISPFEAVAAATPDNEYDAIITNVPFGNNNARGGNQLLDKRYQSETLENYFILRSLEKLKPGGLAVFITPPRCVSGKDGAQKTLRLKAAYKAEFLGAYRLPNSVFGTANADTITDIIAFRKYSDDTAEKIQELLEQSSDTLTEANVLWPEYLNGDYFKGEGKRFILGEFVPKNPDKFRDVDRVNNPASVSEVATMIRKFPDSRINWDLLNTTETSPIIYQDGDTITQAGQTLEMRDGQWIALAKSGNDSQSIELLDKMTTPYEAFINQVSYNDARELADYLIKMSRALDIPDWLHQGLKKINGMPEYWLAGLVGLSCEQVLTENSGDNINYLETYPQLSEAMAQVYTTAKSVPNGLSGNLKDGIKVMISHYSKKKGYSAIWRGDVLDEVQQATMTQDQSFEGLRYRTKSQWIPVQDAKVAMGDDFDPITSNDYCLSGDGESITKSSDYYVGNYGDFLKKIDAEIATASDETLKAKLLRQKIDGQQYIDRIDTNALSFNLFSPYITVEEKVDFLRRFVDPRFAVSMEKNGETVEKYIILDGKSDKSDRDKLLARFGQYMKNGTITLGTAKLNMSTKDGLTELRKMVATANEQFGPWVKSNSSITQRIANSANDPTKLRFKPIDDESEMIIEGLSEKRTPHGYQRSFIRKQGREFGGINGFGVGLGKTLTSLAAVQHVHNIGVKKKTAFIVPNSVLSNWRKEAGEAYQNTDDCLFIGLRTNKKGKDVVNSSAYDEDLNVVRENRHRKIFMTMEAFERIRLRDETISQFSGYIRKVDASFAESDKNAEEEGTKSKLAELMNGLQSKTGSAPFLEDLGIDSVVIDEAHVMKNSSMAVDTKSARYLSLSSPSARGFDAQAKAWYIRGLSPMQDGVLLLTATPITNSPLEIYSMLSLAIGHDKLNDSMLGIKGADNFLSVICDVQSEADVSIDGIERDINVFQGLNNVGMLRKAIGSVADIKSAEDVGNQVALPESEDKAIAIDLPEAITSKLVKYKGAFRYAIDLISEKAINRGDEAAFHEVADYFGEPLELIGHPFNLINKMTMLIADPELDRRGTFYTFSPSQAELAQKAIDTFNAKKIKEKRTRPGPLTIDEMIVGKKVKKDSETDETKIEYTVQVRASIAKNQITIDTMDSNTQSQFEAIADKLGLDMDVTIPPKLAALLDNVKNEAATPRGIDADKKHVPFAKQIIFCDILAMHNKIKRILAKRAGINPAAIAIITGKTNNTPDEILEIQNGFNASGEDNKYRIIIANEKAEVGINLQIGTQAIHHLTIGWTPDSLTQRNGRGVRQGNKTERVTVYHYDADGTFDVAKRAMVNKKSEWIEQVMDVNGDNKVAVTGGLSREQMEALIDVVGDADGMTKLQESIAAKEAENRATTNRDKQIVNIDTIQKQLSFIDDNSTAEKWATKKIQALYAIKQQIQGLQSRLDNAKTETAIAKNKSAIADLQIKFDGLKKHVESAVTIRNYDVDRFLSRSFDKSKWKDQIDYALRGDIVVSENSDLHSDWQSEIDLAKSMIEESKNSFNDRAKQTGAYPASVVEAIANGEGKVIYGKPVVKGTFIRVSGVLALVSDNFNYPIYWITERNYQTSLPLEKALKGNTPIYPDTPDYLQCLIEAAAIEDEIAAQGLAKNPYSNDIPEVKNFRTTTGVAEYAYNNVMLPAPYYPFVEREPTEHSSALKRMIYDNQKKVIKKYGLSTFVVDGDFAVTKLKGDEDQFAALKSFAMANGMKLTLDDVTGYSGRLSQEFSLSISADEFQAVVDSIDNEDEVRIALKNYLFSKVSSWFEGNVEQNGIPVPNIIGNIATVRINAIHEANKEPDKPDDVVAVTGSGTFDWKDAIKEYAADHKPASFNYSSKWDKFNKCWLISRAAWDALIADKPEAARNMQIELSNQKI